MTSVRLFPTSFVRGHSDAPRAPVDPCEAASPAQTLQQRVLTLSRRGGIVDGAEALHQALRQGWRVLQVRSEPPPNAAPLDFAVQVLLGRTQHRHVGPASAPESAPSA